ncbi:MAG: PQQ-dependent sugar dehydrogenase [Trueperaceae bacterium]
MFALAAGCGEPSNPDPTPEPTPELNVELMPVAAGFENPVAATNAADGFGRLFVVERGGLVFVIEGGSVQETPYLDLSDVLGARSGENGLLGLAFHPSFASNGRLFVHYIDDARGNVLAELRADPPSADSVDAGTLDVLLRVLTTTDFHVGGHVAFGPDGYLYAGLGDGGNSSAAQDRADPYGGLLRLDVDGSVVPSVPSTNPFADDPGAYSYTWVYGLRNPWRFSFDAETGDLWIADVGQDDVEEINVLPAGSAGGANYGWPIMEGDACFPPGTTTCDTTGLTVPDFVYTHASGWGSSVTGGFVYRGAAVPDLVGSYVFGDFMSGALFVVPNGADGSQPERLLDTSYRVVSFGVDEAHEILVVDYAGGGIYRLVQTAP